jgi:hypothetical protein
MTETVHEITDVPSSTAAKRKKILKWSAVGVLAFGTLLLVNDRVGGRQKKDLHITVDSEAPASE